MSASIVYARTSEGRIFHINAVDKSSKTAFYCPGCQQPLVAVKSVARKKDWHFRHPATTHIITCRDKALHDYAVQILLESEQVLIRYKLNLHYTQPCKEVCFLGIRSDVNVHAGDEEVHFEIVVKNDLGESKKNVYQSNRIKCVRIDLSDPVYRSMSPEAIKKIVLSSVHNKTLIWWPEEVVMPTAEKETQSWEKIVLWAVGILLAIFMIRPLVVAVGRRLRRRF